MNTLLRRAKEFLRSEDGPTAVEYAVMLALIIVISMTAIGGIGTSVSGIFSGLKGKIPVV